MPTSRSNLAAHALDDQKPAPRATATPRVTLADSGGHTPQFSPARALQARLSAATAATDDDRWSPRATTLFVVGVCTAFWAAVGGTLMAVLR